MLSDLKRLFKHTSVYSLGNVALRAGAFILLPLYTHYLSVAEYGILELLSSTSNIISSFVSMGLAHATLRFYFEYDDIQDRNSVVSTALITAIVVSLVSVLIILIFSETLSTTLFNSNDYVSAINLTLVIIVWEMARQVGLSYMRAKEYSLFYVTVCIVQFVVQVICNIYTVAMLKMGVTGVLIGNMLSVFVGMLICSFLIIRECGVSYQVDKIRRMFAYSYPFLFNGIYSAFVSNADRFIIKAFLSMEAVGIYGLALKIAMLLKEFVIEPFQRGYGAFRFSIMKQNNVADIQSRTLNYLVFVVSWAGLMLSLISADIVYLLTTREYFSVSRFVPLAVLGLVFGSCNYVFHTGILYKRRTIQLLYAGVISGASGVLMCFLLTKYFGLYGALIALVLQSCVSNIIVNSFSQRLFRVDYQYSKLFLCIATATGIYCICFLLYFAWPDLNRYLLLGIKLALVLLYPLSLYVMKFFSDGEINMAFDIMRKVKRACFVSS